MMLVRIIFVALAVSFFPACTQAKAISDDSIKAAIIQKSQENYTGSCPCPDNIDRAGRRCGKRSAYSHPGGASPLCYPSDVTDEMVKDYKSKLGKK